MTRNKPCFLRGVARILNFDQSVYWADFETWRNCTEKDIRNEGWGMLFGFLFNMAGLGAAVWLCMHNLETWCYPCVLIPPLTTVVANFYVLRR